MIATAKSKAKGKEDIFDVRVASYVLVIPKRWPIHAIAFMGSNPPIGGFKKTRRKRLWSR